MDNVTVSTNNCMPTTVPLHVTWSMHKPCQSPWHATHHVTNSSPTLWDAALHGNAFNPDTGELAEYKELSQSSDGHLWQMANATKIHHLAQGHSNTPGTNTMFFIPVTTIPQNQKATYLCIMCTHCPEKATPTRYAGLLGVTRSPTMVMSAPKLPTSSWPNYYSTVWYQPPMPDA